MMQITPVTKVDLEERWARRAKFPVSPLKCLLFDKLAEPMLDDAYDYIRWKVSSGIFSLCDIASTSSGPRHSSNSVIRYQ